MKKRILVELEVDVDKLFYHNDNQSEKECPEYYPFYSNQSCRNMEGCIRYQMATANLISLKEL